MQDTMPVIQLHHNNNKCYVPARQPPSCVPQVLQPCFLLLPEEYAPTMSLQYQPSIAFIVMLLAR
jgi:hypothetical protein